MKVLLISLGTVAGTIAIAIAGLMIYSAIDREDTFVLEHATLEDPDYLQKLAAMDQETVFRSREYFHVYAHRLKRGEGTIFAYRAYSNGSMAFDDETYKKVTIWIAGTPPSVSTRLSLDDPKRVFLVSTSGGSAWPNAGCSGLGSSGAVTISPSSQTFEVAIKATVVPTRNTDLFDRCHPESLSLSFRAAPMSFEGLTPWLGLRGSHPYDETYRRGNIGS